MPLLPQRYSRVGIPRQFSDLDEPLGNFEEMVHVPDARVVLADYQLLRNDFPQLAALSDHAIDKWLIASAAHVSRAQAQQSTVNSRIECVDSAVRAFRPPLYGRATVVEVPGGLVDLKGAGVRPGVVPTHAVHSNGLEYLAVAIGDFLLKSMIDHIFHLAAPHFWSVPVYAVLDLGFDVTDGWRGTAPAGLHVRRAHRRPPGGGSLPAFGSPQQLAQFEIEMLLRSYGITSTTVLNSLEIATGAERMEVSIGGERQSALSPADQAFFSAVARHERSLRIERVNIQLSRGFAPSEPGELLDFGHVHVRPGFEHPLCSAVSDRPYCLGPLLWPDAREYVQPDPLLHVPAEVWHRPNLNELCFPLAQRFRRGLCNREKLRMHLGQRLSSLLEHWPTPDTS